MRFVWILLGVLGIWLVSGISYQLFFQEAPLVSFDQTWNQLFEHEQELFPKDSSDKIEWLSYAINVTPQTRSYFSWTLSGFSFFFWDDIFDDVFASFAMQDSFWEELSWTVDLQRRTSWDVIYFFPKDIVLWWSTWNLELMIAKDMLQNIKNKRLFVQDGYDFGVFTRKPDPQLLLDVLWALWWFVNGNIVSWTTWESIIFPWPISFVPTFQEQMVNTYAVSIDIPLFDIQWTGVLLAQKQRFDFDNIQVWTRYVCEWSITPTHKSIDCTQPSEQEKIHIDLVYVSSQKYKLTVTYTSFDFGEMLVAWLIQQQNGIVFDGEVTVTVPESETMSMYLTTNISTIPYDASLVSKIKDASSLFSVFGVLTWGVE